MRVLLSAYACEPNGGSEPGKGWAFAVELAGQGCEVVVLTCGSHHRAAIEAHAREHGLPENLAFAFHDVPGWNGPGYVETRGIRSHYLAWQATARRTAARLVAERPFDVVHHVTWTVLRWPSFLGGLGSRFVFGPVGGGEVAPRALRPDLPAGGRRTERLRDVINQVGRFDPSVRRCLARADAILVVDEATRRHVPRAMHGKTHVVADIFAPAVAAAPPDRPAPGPAPAILFAGRLEYWKGAQFALGALAQLRETHPGARLTVAGTGPDEGFLRDRAERLGLGAAVHFAGKVPYGEMGALYDAHDVFMFPSLHDSGPHVIGEALARGLPVVCLDLGGPGVAIDGTCGAVVPTAGMDGPALETALAGATVGLVDDPGRLEAARLGALMRARAFTWPRRVADVVERFYGESTVVPALEPALVS